MPDPSNDRRLIYAAALVRSTAMGMIGPLLGFHLAALRFDDGTIGALTSAGLAGAATATAAVLLFGTLFGRRQVLLASTALCLAGGAAAVFAQSAWAFGAAAFVGMLNAMARDRGACLVVEQAMLPETTTDADRTRTFAWYSVMQDAGAALGALCAGLPAILRERAGLAEMPALRASMGTYLALLAVGAVPYLLLSRRVADPPARAPVRVSPEGRGLVARICGLFAIDSVAGGFLTSTFLTLFFVRRFGVDERTVAALFFAKSVLNAASHLGAAWLAKRIGLVNTMVFTHVPSSVLLMTVTVAPSFAAAAALYLVREGLVEMDVPTRNSYVMAVVRPEERTFASAATHLVRLAGWAVGPALAAALMAATGAGLATPLVVGAAMKIAYDVALWASFRRVKPPEERGA